MVVRDANRARQLKLYGDRSSSGNRQARGGHSTVCAGRVLVASRRRDVVKRCEWDVPGISSKYIEYC